MIEDEHSAILDILRTLTFELRELDVGNYVPRVSSLTSVEFLRDYISSNKPVIVTNATSHWPALTRWTRDYLIEAARDALVTVALTPNGRADCPTPLPDGQTAAITTAPAPAAGGVPHSQDQCFALPCQRRTTLATFYQLLDASRADPNAAVPYLQYQNSSLTAELPQLLFDIDFELPWASEAFGIPPEAVNIWIGGRKSITSWHRDHYENLYVMISGRKTLRLLPPVDGWRMALRRYPQATWHLVDQKGSELPDLSDTAPEALLEQVQSGKFELRLHAKEEEKPSGGDNGGSDQVLWSSIPPEPLSSTHSNSVSDHLGPSNYAPNEVGRSKRNNTSTNNMPPHSDLDAYHDLDLPRPLVVTLEPGEVLYLPSCWWHEVLHGGTDDEDGEESKNASDEAVAVNYWYDMKYDVKYACTKAVEALAVAAGLNEG